MAKYSDFNLNFIPHPVTGDVSLLTDEKAINQSLKNMIFTDAYESPFDPKFGGNIRATLFRPADAITAIELKSRIELLIKNREPRVDVNEVSVVPEPQNNKLKITIDYTIKTSSQNVLFDFYLTRVV